MSKLRWQRATTVAAVAVLLSVCVLISTPGTSRAGWEPVGAYLGPVEPVRVLALAQLPTQRWLAGHRGIDLEASVGQTVLASAAGTVTFTGVVVDRPVVTIRHDDGALSSVEPVDAVVVVGDRVQRGDAIGEVNDAPGHCAPQVCVHWGVRVNGEYIDPLNVLAGFGRVVLLPRSAGGRRALHRVTGARCATGLDARQTLHARQPAAMNEKRPSGMRSGLMESSSAGERLPKLLHRARVNLGHP